MVKYLFLDIDGVLNNASSSFTKISRLFAMTSVDEYTEHNTEYLIQHSLRTFDPICVELVNKLLVTTGATLVLSSSHRKCLMNGSTFGSQAHLARLRRYLETMGLDVTDRFDITPELFRTRGEEVQEFLENKAGEVPYVILDDGRDFLAQMVHVWVDPEHGFSFKDFVQASRCLGVETSFLVV